jgi:dihydrofolate reductase
MRKLIMWNVITLDGYFEGEKSWDLSFHGIVWCDELAQFISEQLKSSDMLVFGKTTYEGMAAYWQTAEGEGETTAHMNSIPKLVCSRSLEKADWNNTTIVRDAASEIPALKQQGTGNMFVFGSGNLSQTLMKEKLFDEYRLLVAPVFLGKGKLLFPQGTPYHKLKLLEDRPLSTGGIILRYMPVMDTKA